DLQVGERERVGLIGPNGSGKSTFLRLIAEVQQPDGGKITRPKGSRIGYLAQDISVEGGRTLMTFIRESAPGRAALESELEETTAKLESTGGAHDPADEERLYELGCRVAELHEEIAHFDTHYSEHEAKSILAGLGFKTE